MPRARHLSDSSDNASEVECEDGVEIVATATSTSAKPSTPFSRSKSKQTRKVKSTQPSGTRLCEHDQHGDGEALHEADYDFDFVD
jgi:hypothetical protein